MSATPQPTWQPISWLPTISAAITGSLAAAHEFHGALEQGWERPYRIVEATLARARRVFTEQAADVEVYAEHRRRWQAAALSRAQRHAVEQLAGQGDEWRREVAAIPELTDEPQAKSDLEMGLAALLGQEPRRRRRRQQS